MEIEISEHSKLLEYMPKIQSYKNDFDSLNNLLGKTTLTGKISSLSIAENLFEYMEETKEKFTKLQDSLIGILILEYYNKANSDVELLSERMLDIINRNLRERKADALMLSADEKIQEFLESDTQSEESAKKLQNNLLDFLRKYSIYKDIFLFDVQGKIRLSIRGENTAPNTLDPLIAQTLSEGYCENYREVDFIKTKHPHLFLSVPVKAANQDENIGIVCFCLDFEREVINLFERIQKQKGSNLAIALLDSARNVLMSSNEKSVHVGSKLSIATREGYSYMSTRGRESLVSLADSKGYMDYSGAAFTVCGSKPFHQAFSDVSSSSLNIPEEVQESSSLISEELQKVIDDAENINEDLSDVVINGEIIASKKRSYELNPVLDNVRLISNKISDICFESIRSLQKAVVLSFMEEVKYSTMFAVEQMDRLLYERACNARWFACDSTIRTLMTQDALSNADVGMLEEKLAAQTKLYPFYAVAMVFDDNGHVVAVSSQAHQHFKGKSIDKNSLARIMGNHDTNKYAVSDFRATSFYGKEHTYMFYGTTLSSDGGKRPVGGVALVFDSKKFFNEILSEVVDIEESEEGTFALLIDKHKTVIASTTPDIAVGSEFEVDQSYLGEKSEKGFSGFIRYRDEQYLFGCHKSRGYREFKTKDGYSNDIYALVYKKINTEEDDGIQIEPVAPPANM